MTRSEFTISRKEVEEVRENLLKKAFRLKKTMVVKYRELYDESSADHVRLMLETLIQKEQEDVDMIEEAISKGEFDKDDAMVFDARSFEMLDHLVTQDLEDVNVNDMKSVLLKAMKMSNDIHNVLELMSHEYSNTKVSGILATLAVNQLNNKNYIAELYDEFVNKDYW